MPQRSPGTFSLHGETLGGQVLSTASFEVSFVPWLCGGATYGSEIEPPSTHWLCHGATPDKYLNSCCSDFEQEQ